MKTYLNPEVISFLDQDVMPMHINGQAVYADGNDLIEIVNPATEEVVGKITNAKKSEIDLAVLSAKASFEKVWSKISPTDREHLMLKLADKLEEHQDALAQIITLENGKPVKEAKSSDVIGAVKTIRYYAGWCSKVTGQTLDLAMNQKPGNQNFGFTLREPVGVVAAIVPWNFPISIAAWKFAPALAAGCTVILKPSEVTPMSALYLAKIFKEAGFPDGVFNVVTGDGATTGNQLVSHPDINKIVFTGSSYTGKLIGHAAMDNLVPVSLELGGKSPAIVFNDADLDKATKGVAAGIFRNAGQVCVAGSRAYIQEDVFEEFIATVEQLGKKMKVSHGFDPDVGIGPLASKGHYTKVNECIAKGKVGSTKLYSGGENPHEQGYYMTPTIFTSHDNDAFVVQEEIFGPVLVAIPFKTKEQAMKLANDNAYGLAGTIWTKDVNKALSCVKQLESGLIAVNGPVRSDPHLPLGGFKQSGIGKDLGEAGLLSFTKVKSVNIIFES